MNDFPVEFELEGFSSDADSADTDPTTAGSSGRPQFPSGSQEDASEWPENVASAPTMLREDWGGHLPASPDLSPAASPFDDSVPDMDVTQLVNENARLGMENARLRQQCEDVLNAQAVTRVRGMALEAAALACG